MVSGGSQSSSSKPFFLDFDKHQGNNQLGVASRAFQEILIPRLFGGAPDVGTEAAINRGRQQLSRDASSRGLRGSGIEARMMSNSTAQQVLGREAQFMSMIFNAISPLGQQSKSSGFNFGFKP